MLGPRLFFSMINREPGRFWSFFGSKTSSASPPFSGSRIFYPIQGTRIFSFLTFLLGLSREWSDLFVATPHHIMCRSTDQISYCVDRFISVCFMLRDYILHLSAFYFTAQRTKNLQKFPKYKSKRKETGLSWLFSLLVCGNSSLFEKVKDST